MISIIIIDFTQKDMLAYEHMNKFLARMKCTLRTSTILSCFTIHTWTLVLRIVSVTTKKRLSQNVRKLFLLKEREWRASSEAHIAVVMAEWKTKSQKSTFILTLLPIISDNFSLFFANCLKPLFLYCYLEHVQCSQQTGKTGSWFYWK